MTHRHFLLALRVTAHGFVALVLIMVPLLVVAALSAGPVLQPTDRNGEEVRYQWVLTRQAEDEFKGCWMTSAVIATEPPLQRELVNLRRGR